MTTLLAEDYGHHPVDEVLHVAAIHRLDSLLEEAHALSDIHDRLEAGEPVTVEIAQEAFGFPMVKTLMKRDPQYRIAMEEASVGNFRLAILIAAALAVVLGLILKLIGKDSGGSGGGGGGGGSSTTYRIYTAEGARKSFSTVEAARKDYEESILARSGAKLSLDIEKNTVEAHIVFNPVYTQDFYTFLGQMKSTRSDAIQQEFEQVFTLYRDMAKDLRDASNSDENKSNAVANGRKLLDRIKERHGWTQAAQKTALNMLEEQIKSPAEGSSSMSIDAALKNWLKAASNPILATYGGNIHDDAKHFEKLRDEAEIFRKQMQDASDHAEKQGIVIADYWKRFMRDTNDVSKHLGEYYSQRAKECRLVARHIAGVKKTANILAKNVKVFVEDLLKDVRASGNETEYKQSPQYKAAQDLIKDLEKYAKDPIQ